MAKLMRDSWGPFLPRNAVIMKKKTKVAKAAVVSALEKQKSSDIPKILASETTTDSMDCADVHAFRAIMEDCNKCKLSKGRTQIVYGEGNPKSRIVFVGEAPGEQEDESGHPFVGRSGQLLEKMINAMGFRREDVFICNVVKCRPPENRNPESDEIESCKPYLFRQLDLIKPEVVVALGKFASQTLLETETPITELRGKIHPFRNTKLIPTFHPAYLLRSPSSKKIAWEDLKLAVKELGLEVPATPVAP